MMSDMARKAQEHHDRWLLKFTEASMRHAATRDAYLARLEREPSATRAEQKVWPESVAVAEALRDYARMLETQPDPEAADWDYESGPRCRHWVDGSECDEPCACGHLHALARRVRRV